MNETDTERLKQLAHKLPLPLVIGFLLYLAYDYNEFTTNPESPLLVAQADVQRVQTENRKLQAKLKEREEFAKSLEVRRQNLRILAQELESMKSTLSDTLDVPEFMRMTVTEAKRVGIRVLTLRPLDRRKHEYYGEQPFEMTFRGVYQQLLVFLDRLSQAQKITRVDSFAIRPISSSLSRYVELEGSVQIMAYYYLGSKADQVAANTASAPAAAGGNAPAAGSAPGAGKSAAPGGPAGGGK